MYIYIHDVFTYSDYCRMGDLTDPVSIMGMEVPIFDAEYMKIVIAFLNDLTYSDELEHDDDEQNPNMEHPHTPKLSSGRIYAEQPLNVRHFKLTRTLAQEGGGDDSPEPVWLCMQHDGRYVRQCDAWRSESQKWHPMNSLSEVQTFATRRLAPR